jgi:arylsulfatase A-like enzyme
MKVSVSRRNFLKNLGYIAAFSTLQQFNSCNKTSTLSGSKPNIIFILSDDLSYKDLSCYGQKYFKTPNLDNLALNGIRFSQAYTGAPECAPARASLMTGKHMGHCRIRKNQSVRGQDHLFPEDITVAEILKKAGYVTGFVGKWGIGLPGTAGVPYKKGFNYAYGFYDQKRAHTFYPDFIMENENQIPLPENFGFNMSRVYAYNRRKINNLEDVKNLYNRDGKLLADNVKDPSATVHSENLFQDAALQFIKRNQDNSFFLYYASQLPHGPCITPDIGEFKNKNWGLKNKEWAAMMTHLDGSVGKILQQLEKFKLRKNTIIFFAGDNGYSQWGYFGRPRWEDDPLFKNKGPWKGGKFIAYEGGLRVPFFVNWPERIHPRESTHICSLYDFLVSAADLAGLKPIQTDGISFVPVLENKPNEQKIHDYLYWENNHEQAVRMGPWHAFRRHPSEPVELYKIEEDPQCKKNLAPQNKEIVNRINKIFKEAHEDSEWYVNPGESKEQIQEKRQSAIDLNLLQEAVTANSTFTK